MHSLMVNSPGCSRVIKDRDISQKVPEHSISYNFYISVRNQAKFPLRLARKYPLARNQNGLNSNYPSKDIWYLAQKCLTILYYRLFHL